MKTFHQKIYQNSKYLKNFLKENYLFCKQREITQKKEEQIYIKIGMIAQRKGRINIKTRPKKEVSV